jgi:outer membrane protein assembly factor BamB
VRRLALIAAALALGAGVAVAVILSRGHEHHVRVAPPPPPPTTTRPAPRPGPRPPTFAWPTYGYDAARDHAPRGLRLRPPFRRLWAAFADSSFVEFPPVLERGRLFLGTNHGLVLALDARTGKRVWQRQLDGCVASSPAVAGGRLYLGFMDPPPCTGTAPSFLAALDARRGQTLWRFRAGPIESSPLVSSGLVYFGSWDGRVYALDARTGRVRWSFATGDRVKGGVALANGLVFAGSYDGRLYALDARTGRLRWSAGGLGGLYATPSIAEGRVVVGSTDGSVYAFAARDGRELWSRRTGSFVYAAAAIAGGTVYVGSYDHRLYALAASTGAVRWTYDAGAPISGAPTVLDGVVYFSTCGSCSRYESNSRARRTFGLDARTGRLVWRFGDGEYSPVIADRNRLYVTGYTTVYALAPVCAGRNRRPVKATPKRATVCTAATARKTGRAP